MRPNPMTPPDLTDLTGITRDSRKWLTVVSVYIEGRRYLPWLRLGVTEFHPQEGEGRSLLSAYLRDGATDFEHDSALALRLPLFGSVIESLSTPTVTLHACIPADPEVFRVPRPGYDPFALPGAGPCEKCTGKDKHIFVPEGFYVPPFDQELFDQVRGLRVKIEFMPAGREG